MSIRQTETFDDSLPFSPFSYRTPECDRLALTPKDLSFPVEGSFGPKLFFAGEATHASQYGTVHGAFDSGAREAQRIAKILDTHPHVNDHEVDEGVEILDEPYL